MPSRHRLVVPSMHPEALAFIATSDAASVALALKRLLEADGSRVSMPANQSDGAVTLQAQLTGSTSLARVTVKTGADGWTLVDTDPQELLAVGGGSGKPLLGALCQSVGVVGCLCSVRGPVDAVLMESDSAGNCRLSGCLLSEDDGGESFHGIAIDEKLIRFNIVPFAVDVLDIDDYTQVLQALKAEFGPSA
jgi:hypothetical protein